jgi:hypothetical protein
MNPRLLKMQTCRILFFTLAIFLICCSSSFAENIIGQDRYITVSTIQFLENQGGYEQYFNFFVTLELLVALIALFFRWIGRVMRS